MAKGETKVGLIIEDVHQHGKVMILPIAGEVHIDEEGNFEVDEEVAELLLTNGFGFKSKDGKFEAKKEKESETTLEEEIQEADGLDELDLAGLLEIASVSGFPEEDYKKFQKSKKMMISFLRKNS